MLHDNLMNLRKINKYSQEYVAEKVGVSRQAVAKWESGETTPDIINCRALATLYDVSLDDLVNYENNNTGFGISPKGKHLFGVVKVGEKGQIVIPKTARDLFNINPGDGLVVLGDEEQGIALIKASSMMNIIQNIADLLKKSSDE